MEVLTNLAECRVLIFLLFLSLRLSAVMFPSYRTVSFLLPKTLLIEEALELCLIYLCYTFRHRPQTLPDFEAQVSSGMLNHLLRRSLQSGLFTLDNKKINVTCSEV